MAITESSIATIKSNTNLVPSVVPGPTTGPTTGPITGPTIPYPVVTPVVPIGTFQNIALYFGIFFLFVFFLFMFLRIITGEKNNSAS
jgi:hypothetical protein